MENECQKQNILELPENLPLELVQSVVYTYRKAPALSVYEQRIILQALAVVQDLIKGEDGKLSKNFCVVRDFERSVLFRIRLSSIEKDPANYKLIRDALCTLGRRWFEFKDKSGWWGTMFVNSPAILREGVVVFEINKKFLAALLDLSKGFTRVDFNRAMQLPNSPSLRFFEMCSEQREGYSITKTPEEWRELLGFQGMYPSPSDFILRVFKPSQAILNASCPYTFDMQVNYERIPGRRGKTPIKSITIIPKKQPQFINPEIEAAHLKAKLSARMLSDPEMCLALIRKAGFTNAELQRNKKALEAFSKCDGATEELEKILAKGEKEGWPDMPRGKGKYINALKVYVQQCEEAAKADAEARANPNELSDEELAAQQQKYNVPLRPSQPKAKAKASKQPRVRDKWDESASTLFDDVKD